MLADERKDFQPVDQLFAVLVRFFALAVCSEQQILELVLDGVKGIVAFEELPQLLRRLRLRLPASGLHPSILKRRIIPRREHNLN